MLFLCRSNTIGHLKIYIASSGLCKTARTSLTIASHCFKIPSPCVHSNSHYFQATLLGLCESFGALPRYIFFLRNPSVIGSSELSTTVCVVTHLSIDLNVKIRISIKCLQRHIKTYCGDSGS